MCTARPGPEGLRVARVPACPMWFREALHLVPGACGGRDRRGLVQRDVVGRTRTSELRYGDGIALPVGRDHVIGRGERRRAGSAGGGDRPSLRKHSGTASGRHSPRHHPAKAGGGGDERLHQPTRTGDRLIDLRAASEVITRALRRRRAGRRLEDRFKIGRERLPVDILPGLARPMLGGPDALPARCLVGAARKAGGGGDERLHQPTRTGDRVIDLRAASEVITRALRGRRAGHHPEDRFKIGRERLPVDILSGLARPMLGGPDALPARCLVGAARKAGGGGDERLHQPTRTGDRVIDLRAASEVITRALRGRRARHRPKDRFKIGRERLPVDILSGLARPMLGGPDALPARCLVGAAGKAGGIDTGLDQDRTVRVFLLPVIGPLPGRQAPDDQRPSRPGWAPARRRRSRSGNGPPRDAVSSSSAPEL